MTSRDSKDSALTVDIMLKNKTNEHSSCSLERYEFAFSVLWLQFIVCLKRRNNVFFHLPHHNLIFDIYLHIFVDACVRFLKKIFLGEFKFGWS